MNGTPQTSVQRVVAELRLLVADLSPGAQLPPQERLAKDYDVSRDTVQRALRELRQEGLIRSKQGSGSFVAPRIGPPDEDPDAYSEAEPAIIALDPYLERGLTAADVTIDYFGFSAETLATLLKPRLDLMRLPGASRPQSLHIRLLLPKMSAPLALPRSVADPADPRPLQRLQRLTFDLVRRLTDAVDEVRLRGLIPNVLLEIRTVAMTPQVKIYIINGTEALRGWYEVIEVPVRLPVDPSDAEGEMEEVMIYDLMGLDAALIPQQPAAVDTAQRWFDSIWSTIAEPLED
ncbi:GntR family transcriptional regulator [Streptacidiphilus carbonis]|jgi:DNA-binding transcriptional regulator YhcF (GntR family)|uniref:GntR family transcriptional regulator n=1 Tax=Streptacidiphilus carbonis TaxID=105422 RepID=UPI000A047B03|nr:GntR family transcriptional regulator [Streptacidiphilus carbonis]